MNVRSLILAATAALSIATPAIADQVAVFPSIASEDGYVTNLYTTNTTGTTIKAGKSSYIDYKGIYTFDTSALPADAVITTVALGNYPVSINEGNFDTSTGNIYRYLEDNITIDFGGLYGFGGSFSITSADYYAYSSQSTGFYFNAANGFMMIENAASYINKYGKTQLRISFASNPSNVLLNMAAAEDQTEEDMPALFIVYSSASE